jgi:molecular chaperone GrpE
MNDETEVILEPEAAAQTDELTAELDEAMLLRQELGQVKEDFDKARAEAEDFKSKHLRALAEMQTIRRRVDQDLKLAREQGADSVILTVIPVYDDLRRALEVAASEPTKIIPGIEQVRDTLKRNLEAVGIREIGMVGEDFDPTFHEALTSMPTEDEHLKGKIARVFESGFAKDERVIRVARVVVYQ